MTSVEQVSVKVFLKTKILNNSYSGSHWGGVWGGGGGTPMQGQRPLHPRTPLI